MDLQKHIEVPQKTGSIQQADRRMLLLEIDRMMHLKPEDLPEESKFLLKVDFARL
jgi:hypothetical protein